MSPMKKTRSHFNLILRPEPEGGFTVIVPALPGCVTYGRNLAEAKSMAKDAIAGYIESLKKHKEPIPTDDGSLVTSLEFEYAETSRR
jgi:antitoxin HicB